MDRTKESDVAVLRLPVAYSQGYVYVSVLHDAWSGAPAATVPETDPKPNEPTVQPGDEAVLGPSLALMALAALFGPFMGAGVFVLLQIV